MRSHSLPDWPRLPTAPASTARWQIDHGIERVVHLPPDQPEPLDADRDADLAPASASGTDWVDQLYPARGLDQFLHDALDLQVDPHLLVATVFNGVLDAALQQLRQFDPSTHPGLAAVHQAIELLEQHGVLRTLLQDHRAALLEA